MTVTLCAAALFSTIAAPKLQVQAAETPEAHVAVDPEGAPATPDLRWFDAPQPVGATGAAARQPGSTEFFTLNVDPEGDMPRDLAFTPDGARVLVVNRDTDNVTVFDFASQALVATIPVGDFPVDVEVSPDGSVAAVPNLLSDTVSFIDLSSLSVVATVPVTQTSGAAQPYAVAFDEASTRCLVGVIDGAATSRFSVISLPGLTEVASFVTSPQGAVGGFFTPEAGIFGNLFTDFALSADGTFVLLPDVGNDELNAYATQNGALLGSLPIGDAPSYVDISSDDTAAVVSLRGQVDAVVSLSLSGGVPTVQTTTPTVLGAFDPKVRITPDKAFAIVAVQNAVEFIDLAASQVVSTVNTGTVGDIELTFDDQYAVVTNFNTRVISLATQSQVAQLSLAATAEAAVSPVSHACVGLNNRFAEDLHFYSTNGGSSQVLGRTLSGSAPEVDAPRRVTITPDGTYALIAGNTSRSVALFNLPTRQVTTLFPAGDRVWEIATDPAGTVAVVTSTGSNRVDVVDLVNQQFISTLNVPERPTQVAVSPDGSSAYVTTVAGTDRLWFINIGGPATTAVVGSLTTGQLGTIQYSGGQSSGIALSPDGNTLAICVSFADELLLVDTASRTAITRVPVGDFPIRCAWTPDGSSVFVTNTFGDSVSRVAFTGATSSVTGTLASLDGAFQISIAPSGLFAYVGNVGANTISAIDVSSMALLATVPLPDSPLFQAQTAAGLFVAAGDTLHRLFAAGPQTTLEESITLSGFASDVDFAPAFGRAVTTQPGANDGVDVTYFGGVPQNGCGPAVPNSTGLSGTISARGTFLAGGFPLTLIARNLPQNSFGYFIHSPTPDFVPQAGTSQGNLCLGGTIGRFDAQVQSSGPNGVISIEVDTLNVPYLPQAIFFVPGDTWSFQCWHRDANPSLTSNFTDRLTVTFE